MAICLESQKLTPYYHRSKNSSNNNNITDTNTATSTSSSPSSSIVQLFASDFDITSIIEQQKQQHEKETNEHQDTTTQTSTSKRPRRRIKQVIKYQPSTRNYKQECKLRELAGKVGTGFLCPGCNMHLSYDSKFCWSCKLLCCYVPGSGVVVCKERDSIVRNELLKEKDIILDDDAKNNMVEMNNVDVKKKKNDGVGGSSSGSSMRRSSRKRSENEVISTSTSISISPSTLLPSKVSQGERRDAPLPNSCTKIMPSTNNDTISIPITTYLQGTIGECEACLQLFQATYLQRHRRAVHDLPPEYFACPYCDVSYYSMEERNKHVKKAHAGKPYCIPAHIKGLTKSFVYNCPYCTSTTVTNKKCSNPMTYMDLKDHLREEHSIEMNQVLNDITTSCPFCIIADEKNIKRYRTIDSLLNHISLIHKGCDLIGKKIGIGGNSGDAIEEEEDNGSVEDVSGVVECKKKGDFHQTQYNFRDREESQTSFFNENKEDENFDPNEKYWNELPYDDLRQLFQLDKNSVKLGQTFASLEHFINRKLRKITYLEECHLQTQEKNSSNATAKGGHDDEYTAESKLYVRGLRERAGKAASEALEKLTYKEKWEENNLKFQYENRNLKKSPEELEVEAMTERPIHFVDAPTRKAGAGVSTRATRCNNVCNIGKFCGLCNAGYANHIITDSEIEEAGGEIANAIPISHGSDKTKQIRNLSFWRITDRDLPNDREEVNERKGYSKRSKGRAKHTISEAAWIEYWKLIELRHAMAFIHDYNQGLFLQTTSKK